MSSASPRADGAVERPTHEAVYDVLGVRVRLVSGARTSIDLIDESFGVFRMADNEGAEQIIELRADAALDLMDQLVHTVISSLHRRGLYAIHAASVAHRGRALVLAGPSGAGKTTLALALAALGFELLSDELAVLDPASGLVHPYRRRLHVRPGTPELVRGLERIGLRERRDLGGDIAWAVAQEEVGLPAGGPRPLGGIIILLPRTEALPEPRLTAIGSGRAALELLRGTPAASVDFSGALRAIGPCVSATRCALLEASEPMATAAALVTWFEATPDD